MITMVACACAISQDPVLLSKHVKKFSGLPYAVFFSFSLDTIKQPLVGLNILDISEYVLFCSVKRKRGVYVFVCFVFFSVVVCSDNKSSRRGLNIDEQPTALLARLIVALLDNSFYQQTILWLVNQIHWDSTTR